ncbi:D-beta-D-heptose 7-phosphate kinase [Thermotomaculum hydrothermale]|uniref:D-beta-D-heptose 7-phosphate kinase n=1 Tax=Thermotomaculum hydrothermale TaxID=981385 RepID=A0A7R6SZA8_9BACT|nr:PfkB family carbohydrate kinase [Thermotomaculum hydrothermale]BBB33535.1 D-beta-D-heptose 7-phosphate kinase [Thermotomaculum hydrothermale]
MDNSKFLNAIDNFKNIKLLVIGDIVLDEFQYTEIKRISREAPVFICSYLYSEYYPGCGGNTVLNVKSLGGNPYPVSVVGLDSDGKQIKTTFEKLKINTSFIKFSRKVSTNKKTRILAGGVHRAKQHMLRVDYENTMPSISFNDKLRSLIKQCDGIIISDYGYNTISLRTANSIIKFAKNSGKPVFVDSRHRLNGFKNADFITPNEEEAGDLIGEKIAENGERLIAQLRKLLKLTSAKGILLTRGSKGMVVYERDKDYYSTIGIYGSDEPVDVSGAGDSVISAFALSFCSGLNSEDSAIVSTVAGGISVMHKGTYSVKNSELREAFLNDKGLPERKIVRNN